MLTPTNYDSAQIWTNGVTSFGITWTIPGKISIKISFYVAVQIQSYDALSDVAFSTIFLILTELFYALTLLQIFITMSSKMQNIDIEITLPGRFSKFSPNSILCFDKEDL